MFKFVEQVICYDLIYLFVFSVEQLKALNKIRFICYKFIVNVKRKYFIQDVYILQSFMYIIFFFILILRILYLMG